MSPPEEREPGWILTAPPVVTVQMLIRKTPKVVYEAFTDPAVTSAFWFTRGSAPLAPGARVRWEWEMYGASTEVAVRDLDPERRILIEWDDPATEVEWNFAAQADGSTLVRIINRGFAGSGDELCAKAIDAAGGFSYVLAAAKAYLEHGIRLNLVADHAPEAHVPDWKG